jgi:hypothetical protein
LFDELPLPEHGQAAAGKTPAASASASARARVIRPNRVPPANLHELTI